MTWIDSIDGRRMTPDIAPRAIAAIVAALECEDVDGSDRVALEDARAVLTLLARGGRLEPGQVGVLTPWRWVDRYRVTAAGGDAVVTVESETYPDEPNGAMLWMVRWKTKTWAMVGGVDGQWTAEPDPADRTDEWYEVHTFPDLDEALRVAEEAAVLLATPRVVVDGTAFETDLSTVLATLGRPAPVQEG